MVYSAIESLNQEIIGIEFIDNSLQINGADLPEWRVYNKSFINRWSNAESAELWRRIGNSAYGIKDGYLWDLTNRISHQLRVCGWRIKELSDRYHDQLTAVIERGEHVNEIKFKDNFTWLCYLAIQTFLIDACILRDFLAEFISSYIIESAAKNNKRITTMSSLLREVKKLPKQDDPLVNELLSITGELGWLKSLGDYRDLVVHSAPIDQAETILFAKNRLVKCCGKITPVIECPIPQNPSKSYKTRHNRSLFDDFDELIKALAGLTDTHNSSIDGLSYCHSMLGYLSSFAYKIGLRSKLKPTLKTIYSSDIVGDFVYKKYDSPRRSD
ncbi:hypothetical protein C2U68_02640 [Methylomonas koyamae]|nr:hypothetical protein C2U68_02640 [Methylomonas koyamae]